MRVGGISIEKGKIKSGTCETYRKGTGREKMLSNKETGEIPEGGGWIQSKKGTGTYFTLPYLLP
jgi:hypothetical protein